MATIEVDITRHVILITRILSVAAFLTVQANKRTITASTIGVLVALLILKVGGHFLPG